MQVSAVILSGGLARRFGGVEKGLQPFQGKPMISHIVERLRPQVQSIYLNINRNAECYRVAFPELPCYSDELAGFQGALSGMLSGFQQIDSELLLFVPCDSPFVPRNLLSKLETALRINHADVAYAHDGEKAHPTFALIRRTVMEPLMAYLASGERRLLQFFQQQKSVAVDFSQQPNAFLNFNSQEELARGEILLKKCKIPLLAITGYSDTGKTTLLEKLLPVLSAHGVRVGLMKHSHHNVDVDSKGKDSYRLRHAGANPTMVVCDQRWALMVETAQPASFTELVSQFEDKKVDLILVEGFKHEGIPKIQLHRQGVDKPLPELDSFTLATATDYSLDRENCLDINKVEQIAQVIMAYLQQ